MIVGGYEVLDKSVYNLFLSLGGLCCQDGYEYYDVWGLNVDVEKFKVYDKSSIDSSIDSYNE